MDITALLLGLITGAAIGALVTWGIYRQGGNSDLRKQHDALKQAHEAYQVQVSNHFQETSELVESLNERYQAVSLHIAKGLDELTQPELIHHKARDEEGQNEPLEEAEPERLDMPSAPRDYATKD